MSATLTYTPGTHREVVASGLTVEEATALVLERTPRSGEVLVIENLDGVDGYQTVVALTAGERCPTCGRAGR